MICISVQRLRSRHVAQGDDCVRLCGIRWPGLRNLSTVIVLRTTATMEIPEVFYYRSSEMSKHASGMSCYELPHEEYEVHRHLSKHQRSCQISPLLTLSAPALDATDQSPRPGWLAQPLPMLEDPSRLQKCALAARPPLKSQHVSRSRQPLVYE
jgi:hypothetical protein